MTHLAEFFSKSIIMNQRALQKIFISIRLKEIKEVGQESHVVCCPKGASQIWLIIVVYRWGLKLVVLVLVRLYGDMVQKNLN